MKKEYMKPQIEEMDVEVCDMICTSLGMGGDTATDGVTDADSRDILFEGFEF